MESIIYVISSLLIFILTILVKKNEEKLEITKTIIITIIAQLAFNALVCFIFYILNMNTTLVGLSIINFAVCGVISIIILKEKQIQKYKISISNLIAIIVFFIITFGIYYMQFDGESKIKYLTGDSWNHYKAAKGFFDTSVLSNKIQYVHGGFMFLGYANEGIWFKVFQPFIGTLRLLNVYIFMESMYYMLAGIIFYFLAAGGHKTKTNQIIALIFSVLYVIAYPLHAWISGFHYLIIGMLYLAAILYAVKQESLKTYQHNILMLLLNFGMIFSYCLFCPFIYFAEFIYYFNKHFKDNKKKFFITVFWTLIIPGIMGTLYIVILNFKKTSSMFTLEGYVYKNIWSNFLLFIPFIFYKLYEDVKDKKVCIEDLMFLFELAYIAIFTVLLALHKCSEYYYFKNWYALWVIACYMNVKGIIMLLKKNKQLKNAIFGYIIVYVGLMIIYAFSYIVPQRAVNTDSIHNVMEIYSHNKTMLEYTEPVVTKAEYNLFIEFDKIIDGKWKDIKNDEVFFLTQRDSCFYISCITGFSNYSNKYFGTEELEERINEQLRKNEYKYIIVNKERPPYEDCKDSIDYEKYEMVFDNSTGQILKKKD